MHGDHRTCRRSSPYHAVHSPVPRAVFNYNCVPGHNSQSVDAKGKGIQSNQCGKKTYLVHVLYILIGIILMACHSLLHPSIQGIPINVSVIQGGMFSAGVEVACLLADVAFLEMDGVCAEFFQADW